MTPTPFTAETMLLLAERPDDAVRQCGDLVAALCRAGRPPFVVVLTDGPVRDAAADERVGGGLAAVGLDGRMLMFGIPGDVPGSGPVFDAAVRALCFVSWRHDCNVVCMPEGAGSGMAAVVRAAVAESGLGLAEYAAGQVRMLEVPRRSARADDS